MIKSMTGFGKVSCQTHNRSLFVEIRTLNSKNLDISLKLPTPYKHWEQEIRNLLGRELSRGKIDLLIGFENGQSVDEPSINKILFEKYFHELASMAHKLGLEVGQELIPALLRIPEVTNQPIQDAASDQDWLVLLPEIQKAVDEVNVFRLKEGQQLENDIRERIRIIDGLLENIAPHEGNRKQQMIDRLKRSMNELNENIQTDTNRFEQEIIYYLERLDISEEKVRLGSHLSFFLDTLNAPESSGKKLGFITQEIGREINTIGSKANDADIQKIVVQMKDELEKIKEQLMNIL